MRCGNGMTENDLSLPLKSPYAILCKDNSILPILQVFFYTYTPKMNFCRTPMIFFDKTLFFVKD